MTTASDGKNYRVEYYNLDAILAVGYRVSSQRGTQFRRWATERLREYLVKGYTLDDERLKHPPVAGSGVPPGRCRPAQTSSNTASRSTRKSRLLRIRPRPLSLAANSQSPESMRRNTSTRRLSGSIRAYS